MGVLKRKEERTATITVRVPESIKAEVDQLRPRADGAGFDLNATMAEALVRVVKQVRDELGQLSSKAVSITRSEKANGLADGGSAGVR
jgi:hypothetical protein